MKIGTVSFALGVLVFAGVVLTVKADYSSRPHGPTVVLRAQVTDTSGGTLAYRWRSTDGNITDVNSATTSWTLPAGPGLHFAYLLASNGLGGYTERRIAVNTDALATDSDENENESSRNPYSAPAAQARTADDYRSRITGGEVNNLEVDSPDFVVSIQDNITKAVYPPSGSVKTDLAGEFIVPNLPAGNNYTTYCAPDALSTPVNCSAGFFILGTLTMPAIATTDYLSGFYPGMSISGSLALHDGGPCGTINEFFGVSSTATATAFDTSGNKLAGPVRLNKLGLYSIPLDPTNPNLGTVSVQCEGAPPVTAPITANSFGNGDVLVLSGVSPPFVQSITATLNGSTVATADFTTVTPLPSDIIPRADAFLAEKGLDTRLGACKYYKAIGAVRDCDAQGNLIGAINFDDWKRTEKFGRFATGGTPTFKAAFINKVDLNLARVHQSISYGPNQTAAVVCNHLGATNFFEPTQDDIDNAVANALQNKNLVACVAMDYTVSPGVNNDQPFVRFLIFGPSGELLPSVNLDGRREKFVPGTCVVCHGGDHYAGKFSEDGTGFADVGGHFLPYDVGNFEFSSKRRLKKDDQQLAIYSLNQNVLRAGPTIAERELIAGIPATPGDPNSGYAGWYGGIPPTPGVPNSGAPDGHVLNESYVPLSWIGQSTAATNFYKDVYARSCRTCHVALVDLPRSPATAFGFGYNFDHFWNITPEENFYRADIPEVDVGITVCGGDPQVLRDHSMANSLVTFNRFWFSADPTKNLQGEPNQPAELAQFMSNTCLPGQFP